MRNIPVGTVNSFSVFGTKYQVGNLLYELDNGDCVVEILLVETGEKAEYKLSYINNDPKAE